jgi:hypothetical protein
MITALMLAIRAKIQVLSRPLVTAPSHFGGPAATSAHRGSVLIPTCRQRFRGLQMGPQGLAALRHLVGGLSNGAIE